MQKYFMSYLCIMIRDKLVFILLLPFSLIYGFVVSIRYVLYARGILKSISFDIPIISVGNLSVGGAGKSPHIEYLITFLKPHIKLATLSRGYRRKTSGFLSVTPYMTADQSGDEPLQFKRKYPDVEVAVSESRVLGVPKLLGSQPDIQTVLLDDAFQHRSIKPGMNILLTEYSKPYFADFVMPSGRLREWPSGASRADIIIVTKCPNSITEEQRDDFIEKLSIDAHQRVYFTRYIYGSPYYMYNGSQRLQLSEDHNVILVSAIAGTDYLNRYLEEQVNFVHPLSFEDHHDFSKHEVAQFKRVYDNMDLQKKYILTTEKDAIRLDKHREFLLKERLPIFVLPLKVQFLFDKEEAFQSQIKQFLLDFKI